MENVKVEVIDLFDSDDDNDNKDEDDNEVMNINNQSNLITVKELRADIQKQFWYKFYRGNDCFKNLEPLSFVSR